MGAMTRPMADGGSSRPDWKLPAVRCGLEIALLLLIATYLWANVNSLLLSGAVAVLGIVGSVAVLLYYVHRQAFAWVKYASDQTRRRQQRKRRQRQRREQQLQAQQRSQSED
jgi:beta-lactamase regulating signal transducer with metallopeptidase domain